MLSIYLSACSLLKFFKPLIFRLKCRFFISHLTPCLPVRSCSSVYGFVSAVNPRGWTVGQMFGRTFPSKAEGTYLPIAYANPAAVFLKVIVACSYPKGDHRFVGIGVVVSASHLLPADVTFQMWMTTLFVRDANFFIVIF